MLALSGFVKVQERMRRTSGKQRLGARSAKYAISHGISRGEGDHAQPCQQPGRLAETAGSGCRICGARRSQLRAKGSISRRHAALSLPSVELRRSRAPGPPPFRRPGDEPTAPTAESIPARTRAVAAKRRRASPRPWGAPPIRSRGEIREASAPWCAHRRRAETRLQRPATSIPACASTMAAASPFGPEPTTHALRPANRVVAWGGALKLLSSCA